MDKLRDNLWIGGAEPAKNSETLAELSSLGITAVLNVAGEITDHASRALPLMCKVGLTEHAGCDAPGIAAALALLCGLLDSGHKVYLHCAAGANRSPYIAAMCLARREGLSFDDAFAQVRAAHPSASASNGMVAFYGKSEIR